MDKEIFVQNVKHFCRLKGVKPTNACKESGVGGSFLSDINRGQTPSAAKVQMLAQYLGVTTSELLGEKAARMGGETKEVNPVNAKFEINPTLLVDAVEVLRFAVDRCEAEAAALARLDFPESKALARERLAMAKKADTLLFFFAQQ